MTSSLNEYFAALTRLMANKPIRVPKGVRITNDSVALEAGRSKGSIKKSRAVFTDLIIAIDDGRAAQIQSEMAEKVKLDTANETTAQYRQQLDAAFAREISLLHEVYALRKQLAALTGSSVIPIRKAVPSV